MRFLSGIMVGAVLIVGAAYVHDASVGGEPDRPSRTLVNWEVAGEVGRNAADWLRSQVDWVAAQFHRG